MILLPNYAFYFCLLILNCANGEVIHDLGGAWILVHDGSTASLTGTVPGGIYTDLMDNNIIDDIFWHFNDREVQWVARLNWTYSRSFTVTQEFLNNDNINLVFDGLDTFATVFINDVKIGTTDNMFVRYEFDIKSVLQQTENTITVRFLSPIEVSTSLYNKQAEDYIVPPTCLPDEYQGECHANHVRKMQASFAWDWGPAFPSVGIWKPVYLEAYNFSVIRDVTVNMELNNTSESWDIELTTYLAKSANATLNGYIVFEIEIDNTEVIFSELKVSQNENGDLLDIKRFSIPQSSVQLWWPNGYGDPKLYPMKVIIRNDNVGTETSEKAFKVGFRTVELVQEVLEDDKGTTFYFVVNNVPMFAKGVNTIPINILPERGQDSATIRFLLQSAKDAHMNMLRVWGGGTYESDEFYEIADEIGILVWQDFMFACSMYPTNEEFLSTVKDEVRHQVRRLQHHASVALWAANNENEAALRDNWYGTASNFSLYKEDFITLYVDTIEQEVLKSDTSRQFLTSSPTNGIKSLEEGYVAIWPGDPKYGDVHYYNYVNDSWDQNIFPVTRFASEYGYQSLPSLSTLLTATDNVEDLQFNSEFLVHRQHHPNGYEEMKSLIDQRLNLPSEAREDHYKYFIFYSQIQQAMAVKQQTEYYRLWRGNENEIGQGYTMGALYWQLNDVWVGPTWAGIDFKLNWKMLHYYARDFFAPVIITSHLQPDRNVKLFVVSDLLTTVIGATATVYVYRWNSFTPIYDETFNIDVPPLAATEFASFTLDQYLSEADCGTLEESQNNCFIYLVLEDNNNNKIAPNNQIFPGPLNTADLTAATVTITRITQNGAKFELEITTNAISLFVWLDSGDIRGRFSENGFLQVTETKIVSFYPEHSTTIAELSGNVVVNHLLEVEPSSANSIAYGTLTLFSALLLQKML